MLRDSKDEAFYAAPLVNFPTLGSEFIDWFCNQIDFPFKLDPKKVWPLFVEAGYRPELLGSAAESFSIRFRN
jgi:hypothetical protein